jgi:hypothetical protein
MRFHVERVIGGSPSQKQETLRTLEESFDTQSFAAENLKDIEVVKSPEILKCIETANTAVTAVLRKYSIESESVPADKIHTIQGDVWPTSLSNTAAFFSFKDQDIVIPDNVPAVKLAYFLVHEILHFDSYLAAQVLSNGSFDSYRTGFAMTTRDGNIERFTCINEAITEILAIEAFHTEEFQSAFKSDLESIKLFIEHNSDAVQHNGMPLFTDETFYAKEMGITETGSVMITTSEFTYQKEREALQLLIRKLYEKNIPTFSSDEEIKAMFIKSAYTGNFLSIGKLIERSFGLGSFRTIAEQGSGEKLLACVQNLG